MYESLQTDTSASADPQTSGPLIESAEPIREPTKFRISHDSETVYLGERNEWLLVKDGTNTNTLYAMHSLWRREVPIVEAVLRRASEFVPGGGAVHVSMLKTAGGAFRLRMESPVTGTVTEIPDREDQKREWSPRRFSYGGLSFVWKEPTDSPKYRKYRWETCYETKAVRPKEGSKSGKMVDEIVGPRLSWGEDNGGMGTNHTLYFASGLDQLFREHLLASHLARLTRIKFPPYLGGQYGSAYRLKALK